MFIIDFENLVNKLRFNDAPVHSLRNLFALITGDMLITTEDFENWFADAVAALGLVEGLHYKYREDDDVESVLVRGSVGLNLLLREQNTLSSRAQDICGVTQVPMRQA